jgi:hypothetical protein
MFFSYFSTVQPFSHLQSISFIYEIDDERTDINQNSGRMSPSSLSHSA